MTGTGLQRRGRPIGALALASLALALWLAVRLPEVARRYAATMAAIAPMLDTRRATPSAPSRLSPSHLSPSRLGPPISAPLQQVAIAPLPRQTIGVAQSSVSAGRHQPGQATAAPDGPNQAPPEIVERQRAAPDAPALVATGDAAPAPGFDLATSAYARLAAGDRRAADRLFAAALVKGQSAPQAAQWAAERRRLHRRWSGDVYMLFRDSGTGGVAASPVLGGGQSGASLGFALDPLALRPVALIGRVYVAHDPQGVVDVATAQAAIGMQWRPFPGVSIAAERLIGIGEATSGDWNLRLAAGGERRAGLVVFDGYAEAGVRGNGDAYAGGELHAALPLGALGPVRIAAGPGAWGSVQSGFSTVSRIDVGGGVVARLPSGLAARAEWRWRVAGNAQPGSGPALTVSAAF